MRKRTSSKVKWLLAAALLIGEAAWAGPNQQANQTKNVDLVIALDTSNSMDGLIDAAREKLWDVVTVLGKAKPRPVLRVGLISYGNTAYSAQAGWVRKDLDLTTNLDEVYAKLFALRTSGGDEYVARAVRDAVEQMQWSKDEGTLRMIFVAGNEPANQDPKVSVESAISGARQHNIFVNAIYCGSPQAGEAVGWRQVATIGKGQFAAIDQNQQVAIATPMDDELNRLSGELNRTYVGYGAQARDRAEAQAVGDRAAFGKSPSAGAGRAAAKATSLYKNDEWDAVDARKAGKKIAFEPTSELGRMSESERNAFLDKKQKDREALQKQIEQLSGQRQGYIAAEKAKKKGSLTFDDAIMGAVKSEAEASGFGF
jgi:hypothetical protein